MSALEIDSAFGSLHIDEGEFPVENSEANRIPEEVFLFDKLPKDLKEVILSWLKVTDLNRLKLVCREWFDLVTSHTVWQRVYERNFEQDQDQLTSDEHRFFWAVKRNLLPAVQLLHQKKSDLLESSYDRGFSPLYRAAQKGHTGIVMFLVEKGANVEAHEGDGSTPLYIACQENKLSVVKYLLTKEANLEATFKSGFTSMYIAAQKGHLEIVKCLLEHGANVNAAAEHGATPLYIACQNGHRDVVEYLISKNADIEATFKDGFTPIYIASQKGQKGIVQLLISKGANIEARGGDSSPIYVAAQNGHYEVAEELINSGANIEAKYKGFYTPLYIAAQKGHLQILRLLISKGANLEQKCDRGSTALYVSSQNGHMEVVKELIKYGANPHVVFNNNYKKRKPIDIGRENGHKEIERLLKEYMDSKAFEKMEVERTKPEKSSSAGTTEAGPTWQ